MRGKNLDWKPACSLPASPGLPKWGREQKLSAPGAWASWEALWLQALGLAGMRNGVPEAPAAGGQGRAGCGPRQGKVEMLPRVAASRWLCCRPMVCPPSPNPSCQGWGSSIKAALGVTHALTPRALSYVFQAVASKCPPTSIPDLNGCQRTPWDSHTAHTALPAAQAVGSKLLCRGLPKTETSTGSAEKASCPTPWTSAA